MTKKPSVLLVCPNPPWKIGGVERHTGEIARLCRDRHGIKTVIFCSSPIAKDLGETVWNGVPVRVFRRQRVFPYWPCGFFEAINKVKQSRSFDIIHIHGVRSLEPLLTTFRNFDDLPYCLTPHYHPQASNVFLSLMKYFYDPIFLSRLLKNAKKVICVSEIEEQLILRKFGKSLGSKTTVIPNGVDLLKFRRNPLHQTKSFITLLYVGRLEKYKNVDVAIKTVKKLGNDYVLRIIGAGSYKQELQRLANSLGLRNVLFHGVVSDEIVYQNFENCDVLINFSEIEAFGISVLEALAARKPAVVNNKFGLRELAKKFPDAVFSVDIKKVDVEEIAQKIIDALGVEVDVDLSYFDWKQVADTTANLYSQIIEDYD